MKLTKLMQKVIVNTVNGEMLGYVIDMEIDMNTYEIRYFIIEDKPMILARFFPWFFKSKSLQVKVNDISSIGSDVVLVENDKLK